MYKRILPLLLGLFLLFFSGKPASSKYCGHRIDIDGPNTGQVLKVEVIEPGVGIKATYSNPTFPLYYAGGDALYLEIKYYLNNSYHFAIAGSGADCYTNNYHPATQGSVTVLAACYDSQVQYIDLDPLEYWLCP